MWKRTLIRCLKLFTCRIWCRYKYWKYQAVLLPNYCIVPENISTLLLFSHLSPSLWKVQIMLILSFGILLLLSPSYSWNFQYTSLDWVSSFFWNNNVVINSFNSLRVLKYVVSKCSQFSVREKLQITQGSISSRLLNSLSESCSVIDRLLSYSYNYLNHLTYEVALST